MDLLDFTSRAPPLAEGGARSLLSEFAHLRTRKVTTAPPGGGAHRASECDKTPARSSELSGLKDI
eukprot:779921-Prymnesium_polylepis.3